MHSRVGRHLHSPFASVADIHCIMNRSVIHYRGYEQVTRLAVSRGIMDAFLRAALEEAKLGLAEGGIPIGSVLVIDNKIVGRGHNRRVQRGSAILHAEMDCIENAGRLTVGDYRRSVLYSTLSPCDMCSGAALLYRIPEIVIGENRTFKGPEEHLRSRGVRLQIIQDPECIRLMQEFIRSRPQLWNEDIGV
jgi:cytosine/creatinine deaminase